MVGKGLQEAQVIRPIWADVTRPIGDREHSDHAALAEQRRDGQVADALLREMRSQPFVRDGTHQPKPAGLRRNPSPDALARIELGLLDRFEVLLAVEHNPEGRLLVERKHKDLRPLGSEHLPRLPQECLDDVIEVRDLVQRSSGLVEDLEALMLLADAAVDAIGADHHPRHHDRQPNRVRSDPENRHRHQGDAGVEERCDGPRSDQLGDVWRASDGQPDREADQQEAQDVGTDRGSHRADPAGRPERVTCGYDQAEGEDRRARDAGEVREVERELDQWLPAMHRKRECTPQDKGHQQFARSDEEQAHHERDLAQGERMPVPAELEVND